MKENQTHRSPRSFATNILQPIETPNRIKNKTQKNLTLYTHMNPEL